MGGHRAVEMVPYDADWAVQYAAARDELSLALPEALAIHHIGSTSVPGLVAKPILDLVVVLEDVTSLRTDQSPLTRLGYVWKPRNFAEDPHHLFLSRDTDGRRTHHLHVFAAASPHVTDNLMFRDFLRAIPAAARRYAEEKLALAERFPDSRGDYAAAKDPIMARLMVQARRWSDGVS